MAAVITDNSSRNDISTNLYQIANDSASSYLAPTNTFDDSSDGATLNYYVTNADPGVTKKDVTVNGKTYSCKVVYGTNLTTLKDGTASIFKANATIFFDAGNYTDDLEYDGYSRKNLSLVGLSVDSSGEPATVITRSPPSYYSSSKKLDRRVINAADIYMQNLIFSGGGQDMAYDGEPGAGGKRGEYFFSVSTDAKNLVMKDVTIENVGASNSDGFSNFHKNVALYVYASSVQKNFENLTIKNVKTTQSALGQGFGAIFLNQSYECYFKNLTVDMSDAAANASSFSIQNSAAAPTYAENSPAIFSGSINLSDKNIYVQDYRYQNIVVPYDSADPSSFRYIQYNTVNGSTTANAMNVCSALPAYRAGSTNYAVLDRLDNYWLVREGNSVSVNDQLTYIKNAVATMTTVYSGKARNIPPINIKLIADGDIDSFTVPDFGAGVKVKIIALKDINDAYTSTALVPVAAGAVFNLGSTTNSANVALYNFDFSTDAGYTYQHATAGVTGALTPADSYDGTYASGNKLKYSEYALVGGAAKVTGTTGTVIAPTAFVNCKFAELAKGLTLAPATNSVSIGGTIAVSGSISSFYTAEDAAGFTGTPDTTDRDLTIHYFSSNSNVASVDETTGTITGKSAGSAVIYAKAGDKNNDGEIEKPWNSFSVSVTAAAATGSSVATDQSMSKVSSSTDNGITTTTVTANADRLNSYVSAASSGSSVVFTVPQNSGATVSRLDITLKTIGDMAQKSMTLNINSGDVAYSVPAAAVDTASAANNLGATNLSDVIFAVSIAPASTGDTAALTELASSGGFEIVSRAVTFTVTAAYNGKSTEIENFGSYVARAIKLDGGADPSKITTAITVDADGNVRHIPTKVYKGTDGYYYAAINSLTNSTYAIIYNAVAFDDAKGAWYEAQVDEMASRKILAGFSDGTFNGGSAITRAEFAAVIVRALGLPQDTASKFSDVSGSSWYNGYVGAAYKSGIITGRSSTVFDPNANITREEAMAMIERAAKIAGYSGTASNVGTYSDMNEVSAWASDAVNFNLENGLIVGSGGQMQPHDTITRAETATVVLRLLQKDGLVDIRSHV